MAQTILLAGWESQGLRCPDHTISLQKPSGEVFPVALIQMPNGTGKTTTLSLLRAALSGAGANNAWSAQHVRSFAKRGNESGTGFFRVKLVVNSRLTTFAMNFNFEDGTVHYSSTLGQGMRSGFHPPQGVEKFLIPSFVNFFVFDGELAENLLSSQHTDAQTVIENLFQLSVFDDIRNAVNTYYDRQTERRGAQEERGLARRRNRVDLLRVKLREATEARAQATARLLESQRRLAKHKARYEEELKKERSHGQRLAEAKQVWAQSQAEVKRLAKELLARMKDPHALSEAFAREMIDLKLSLDRAKLPETTAREFFEELADEDECVCGRPLDDQYRAAIRTRAKQYLGSADNAFLNHLKSDVATLVGADTALHQNDAAIIQQKLEAAMSKEDEARMLCEELEADVVAGDPALQRAKQDIQRLEDDVERLAGTKAKYESPDDSQNDDNTFGVKILARRLEDAEHKLAEITDTINLRRKRNTLLTILQTAQEKARRGLSREICANTNERIAAVMPFNAVRVKDVQKCLVLDGQEGGSAGETLSVAYAFLATLFNRVEHQLPFVVDSPAGPIDLAVRQRVADLIPKLTKQFVAFTISTERQGFVEPLSSAAGSAVHYVTLFRNGDSDLERLARAEPGFAGTADGSVVVGSSFFMSFHVESEGGQRAVSHTKGR